MDNVEVTSTPAAPAAPAAPSTPDRIAANGVGCLSEAALDELLTAGARRDARQLDALLGSLCYLVGGLEYSLVEQGWSTARIRVYVGDASVLLWVPAQDIR